MDPVVAIPARPLLRGVSHLLMLPVAIGLGVWLVIAAEGARATVAAALFAAAVAAMFGASGLYHRVRWGERLRPLMRRIDHSAIFLVVGGSYAAYGLLAVEAPWRWVVLGIVWAGVAAGIGLRVFWLRAPGWITVGLAIALGWVSLGVLPMILDAVGIAGLSLLVAGGVLYTAGGLVYGLRRPDPSPAVFGFHELFHLLVIGAVACHYASVAFWLLPGA